MNTARIPPITSVILVATTLLALSGCAFGTRQADLSYPPHEQGEGKVIAVAKADPAGMPGCCEVLLTVRDMRARTDRVGNVRNGFGMDTADVVTDVDVRTWVEDAFRHDLAQAGWVVLPAAVVPGDDAVRLDADITKVHCDAYLSYDGNVAMSVTLAQPGAQPFERHYEGSGSVGISWAATAKSYAESLSLALQDAIAQVMTDLARYERH
mgnify:CR=1 FL=1